MTAAEDLEPIQQLADIADDISLRYFAAGAVPTQTENVRCSAWLRMRSSSSRRGVGCRSGWCSWKTASLTRSPNQVGMGRWSLVADASPWRFPGFSRRPSKSVSIVTGGRRLMKFR